MPDDPDPPRKFYALKPKEFERVNDAPASASPPDLRTDPGIPTAAVRRIDVRELARQAAAPGRLLDGTNAPANRRNDVHGVLRDNFTHAEAAGLNDVVLPSKRRSRRKRDYWLVMSIVNGFFAFWAFGPYGNAVTLVYGIGGMAAFTTAFTWVMFFIVDDY